MKIKINWDHVNKFLKVTSSTPVDLLVWLNKIIERHGGQLGLRYPCRETPYMNKWSLGNSGCIPIEDWVTAQTEIDQASIFVPHIIANMDVYAIWAKLRFDPTWRNELLTKLKEHYKL